MQFLGRALYGIFEWNILPLEQAERQENPFCGKDKMRWGRNIGEIMIALQQRCCVLTGDGQDLFYLFKGSQFFFKLINYFPWLSHNSMFLSMINPNDFSVKMVWICMELIPA